MSQILSEDSTLSLYNKGHKVFRTSFDVRQNTLPIVNLDELLEGSGAKKRVQNLNPQTLYFSLKNKGLEDSVHVLPLVSKEQFTKLVDYDVWDRGEVSPKKMFQWLDLYKKIEPKQMLERYRDLEEEYQIACLAPYVRAYTEEEFEKMSDAEQDSLFSFPGKEIYFSVVGLDEKTEASVLNFFEISGELDIEYAVSLLAHLTFCPPQEQAELVRQFRNARLEEDGFVTEEEARTLFFPLDKAAMEKKVVSSSTESGSQVPALAQGEDFLSRVMEAIKEHHSEVYEQTQQSLMFLVNGACASVDLDMSDVTEMKHLMKVTKGTLSLGLDLLSKGDVNLAASLLAKTFHPKEIFRYAVSCLLEEKRAFLKSLEEAGCLKEANKFFEDLDLGRFGSLLDRVDRELLDTFGSEGVEVIKAFLGRFSFYPEISDDKSLGKESLLLFSVISRVSHLEEALKHLNNFKISVKKAS